MSITTQQIKKLFPKAKPALVKAVVEGWPTAEAAYITTPERISQFLANVGAETGGLTAIEENMNYTAERIRQVWPSRFKSVDAAKPYAGQPAKLANKVYGKRLGNKGGSDGWDFRGGGMLQTTGRENYRKMGFEHNPDGLREPVQAFATAVREWKNRGCNALADNRATAAIRKKINGGTNGLDHVQNYLVKARSIFAGYKPASAPKPTPAPKPVPKPVPKPQPAPAPAFVAERADVQHVQSMLWTLGFTEVGSRDEKTGVFDGIKGKFTNTAILAYRNERGVMPITDAIDEPLIVRLEIDVEKGWRRSLAPARTEATEAQVAAKVPEVKVTLRTRIAAWWTSVTGIVGGGAYGIVTNLGAAKAYVDPVRESLPDVPQWAWFVAIGAAALVLYWWMNKGTAAGVGRFQNGQSR